MGPVLMWGDDQEAWERLRAISSRALQQRWYREGKRHTIGERRSSFCEVMITAKGGKRLRYHRIHVLGGPGSGKSFVAANIAARYGMAAYDLDELFWDSAAPTYGVRADPHQRDQALAALVRQEAWVIEGAYYKWLTPSFERADLILLLTPSVWLRDWRLLKRSALQRLGRSSSKKKETFASLVGLMRWNHTYDKRVLAPARVLLARLDKHPIECRTLAQVWAVLAEERRPA